MKIHLLLAIFLLPLQVFADVTVLVPVNVISMATGEIARNRAVVVESGKITAILDAGAAPGADESTMVIEGNGGWVIPGLAEMHAHVPSQSRGEQYARDILSLFLANGVTTVRGMLGEPWHLELRGRLESSEWVGPRLITSGPSFNGRSVSSPEQASRRVREQAAAGYDFLKLHPGLEADEFAVIAASAREAGIPFAGHVSWAVGLDAALRERQATIDHLDGYAQAMVSADATLHGQEPQWFGLNLAPDMDSRRAPELAMATALAGVWNVPTQSLLETTAGDAPLTDLLDRPGMEFLSPELRERWVQSVKRIRSEAEPSQRAAFIAARRALIVALQDARAGLLLGSDAPQIMNVPGFSVHQELAYLVEAGLSPLQALQSGTINVARFLGDRNRGEVAAGHKADFILLQENPLLDIRASRSIEGIMHAGRWFGRERLDRMLKEVQARGI